LKIRLDLDRSPQIPPMMFNVGGGAAVPMHGAASAADFLSLTV
jgi:hypothetical protein